MTCLFYQQKITTILLLLGCLLFSIFSNAQQVDIDWYSESDNNGLIIQNSFPKGGLYHGVTNEHYHYSYLVFYSRIFNTTQQSIELNLNFSAEPIEIPGSPNTFVKLFLPNEKMSLDKNSAFSYGVTELESLEESSCFHNILHPNTDCLFYVVAIFYQTNKDSFYEERGGNRAELELKGTQFYYKMQPQIDSLYCGEMIKIK